MNKTRTRIQKLDSIKHLLLPWIDKSIASIRVQINPGSFFWRYKNSFHIAYSMHIGPRFEDEWAVKRDIPPMNIPQSVLGRGSLREIGLIFWVNKWGKVKTWKIGNIEWNALRKRADGSRNLPGYSCRAKSIEDTTRIYRDDVMLLKQFGPWISSFAPMITFEMNTSHTYFKYFNVMRIYVRLPWDLPEYQTKKVSVPL